MKTYTITAVQLRECLSAMACGEACISDNGRESVYISNLDIIKKLQKAQRELALIEFEC